MQPRRGELKTAQIRGPDQKNCSFSRQAIYNPERVHDVKEKPRMVERAMLIGITLPGDTDTTTRSLLDELRELVTTLGIDIQHEVQIAILKPQAKFLLGSTRQT